MQLSRRLARLRGLPLEFDLQPYDSALSDINRLGHDMGRLATEELTARARHFRLLAESGTALDELRLPFFALVREASWRALQLRPFDVQVVAALALDRGRIVEMQTGEGKTLAAVLSASFNALPGRGVHVLTFNDYLARRDAEWMGPLYRLLGLSVEFVQEGMTAAERRHAYRADITYVTAKEAGFDHLRDELAMEPSQLVHRPFNVALVDEADSLLIDEARIPLVIAGRLEDRARPLRRLADLVASLTRGVDYDLDEYARNVELTEAGVEVVERALDCGRLHDEANYALLTGLNCALHAQVLLRRDVDYLVREGRIELIDEFTGRVVRDRHWPDGLQAALEAKEGVERQADGRILGSIALQHFLSLYPRLSGMTGTAETSAVELQAVYGLQTVVIPTNRPMIRVDHPDLVFSHREAKWRAVVGEIRRVHASGRPVLVGTPSVEESEVLAARLRDAGIACEVLNARNDAAEAAIVGRAGMFGAVTISTNMAGRGTDIRLGGEDESGRSRVAALGGLYVIGTSRHESRRVDLQLRGRAGRQGDPGASRFFVSLEDDLLVRFGIRDLLPARIVGERSEDPLDNPVVAREIARAQRIVEGQNLEIRKTLWRYASVIERQRQRLMEQRREILEAREPLGLWSQSPTRRDELIAAVGETEVCRAEQQVALAHITRVWREHLALVDDLREGIHLVALGGRDPLTHFTTEIGSAFERLEDSLEASILASLDRVAIRNGVLDLSALDIKGPSSTWTYLVNDDPFRNQIGMLLTGPGRASVAIYSALFLMPLLVAWGLVDRWVRRRPSRRPKPLDRR